MDIRKTVIPFAAALLVACGISQEPASSESAPAPAAIDPAPAVSSGLDADGITAARAQAKSLQEQIDARSAILEAPPAS